MACFPLTTYLDVLRNMKDVPSCHHHHHLWEGSFSTTMFEQICVTPLPFSGGHDHVSPNFRRLFEPPSPTVDTIVSPCKFAHCGGTQSFNLQPFVQS